MTPIEIRSPSSRVQRDWFQRNLVAWVLVLLATASAAAQVTFPTPLTPLMPIVNQPNGFVVELPATTTYSPNNGLRLQVDTRWPFNFGYRPIRLRVTSDKPTTAEHRITMHAHISAWDRELIDLSQSFDMPLGATEARATIRCPQLASNYWYGWDVYVDGVRDRELSVNEAAAKNLSAFNGRGRPNNPLNFLVVGPASRNLKTLGAEFDAFTAFSITLGELPDRWIDYSAIDVVALKPAELDELSRSRPEALIALERWVRSGGQLWVHPAGDHWNALGIVERCLRLAAPSEANERATESEAAVAARGWRPVAFDSLRGPRLTFQHIPTGEVRVTRDADEIARLRNDPDYIVTVDETPPETPTTSEGTRGNRPADSTQWYLERGLGMGHVRAFRREWDPAGFNYSLQMLGGVGRNSENATSPLAATLSTTRSWQSRHGLVPEQANEDFADLLVPGVGLAPVTEFRVLITLFVLVIGPLNYWLLARTNRLHLLLLTVPLMALGLTVGLFGYAFLSDGLSTTVRVRSYTTLDQSTGEAASWARLSYYAGLAPGGGLAFSDDVTLYPILPGWNENDDDGEFSVTHKLDWREGEQRLISGWLRSRVPTQYLSVRARKSPHRLRIEPRAGGLAATNELGTGITFVAAVDGQGQVYTGESISDRAATELTLSTHAEALRQLRTLILENQPEAPPSLADDLSFSRSQRRRQRMLRQRFGLDYSEDRLSENLLSEAITAIAAASDYSEPNMPRKSYVAITETGPEVELGIADAEEQASFHVLVGNW